MVFFRVVRYAQNQLLHRGIDNDVMVVCGACKYENVPEKNYFKKIDKHGFESLGYYFWDLWAYQRWVWFERNKGKAKICFNEPVALKNFLHEKKASKHKRMLREESHTKLGRLFAIR
ncbi:MAG: hypothetical protein AABX08_01050 [Nanoarchaeota archaeon]